MAAVPCRTQRHDNQTREEMTKLQNQAKQNLNRHQ